MFRNYFRRGLHVLAAGTTAAGLLHGAETASSSVPAGHPDIASQQALVKKYCVGCHNEKLKTANIMLDTMHLDNVTERGMAWEKVLRKVKTGEMPPAKLPRPTTEEASAFTSYLEGALDHAAAANPNPGRPVIHRLNRAEYSNAVRDLLGLDIDIGSNLPADDSGYGFDNIGDVLSTSPVLLERYLSLARRVSRLAVGDPEIKPTIDQFSLERNVRQTDQVSEDLPFGSRGGMAIRYHFPLDGEYTFKITLRGGPTAIEPLQFRTAVKAGTRTVGVTFLKTSEKAELVGPAAPRGNQFLMARTYGTVDEPELPAEIDLRIDGARAKLFQVVRATPPPLDSILIGGPYNVTGSGETASRKKVFVCQPDKPQQETACAKKILSNLAYHAYRRPVTDADMKPLMGFYQAGRAKGSFESGIELALRAILVSPDFIYRIERDPATNVAAPVHKINDFELASRLSFFLWSSIPDDELLTLARQNKLSQPAVLEAQVRRMLQDKRADALVTNFAGQWLYLRNMAAVKPDPDAFPDFDDSLRKGFQEQTQLFFKSILREDRSALELLDANYTFLNERVARHYGINGIHGSQFRRVSLDPNDPAQDSRRGILGQGSILTVTSYPNRTSPVLRGKWILDNLLGAPPPPPPANVPDLKAHNADGKLLPLRQQMEQHRANAVCASCHSRMDPLGFALENMDGTGKWRTKDAGTDIDSSGVLPNGAKFAGPAGLRNVLLSRRDEFAETITEKLLTYALGRGLEYYDKPTVRQITREAARDNYRMSAFILAIAKSTPFEMRRTQQP